MYSFLLQSRILPEQSYQFFTYNAKKPVLVNFRGTETKIENGMKFGVRPSTNGKFIRLIFPKDPTRVMTVDLETAKKLAKGAAPKAGKK